jgi:FkbM family methyltransferase
MSWEYLNQKRYTYDLTPESIVFDCGGYEGEFATNIYNMYACDVYLYEPIDKFYAMCLQTMRHNQTLRAFKKGVGNSNRKEVFKVASNETGKFSHGIDEVIDIVDIKDAIGSLTVDLLKLNIEGMEYEVLERILECGIQKQIKNIQVQFHDINKIQNRYVFNLIRKGDLVFDVGASYGNKSTLFKELGASVVAFEPQNECIPHLMTKNVTVEHVALDKKKGTSIIHKSDATTISSMSDEFINTVKDGRFQGCKWNKDQEVMTDTLDNMIDKHGTPRFIKIDVEGFELNVLQGLTKNVDYISIEFTPELIETTIKCMDLFPDATFKYSSKETHEFMTETWLSYEGFVSFLRTVPKDGIEFGDIYIKNTKEKEEDKIYDIDYVKRYEKIRDELLKTHHLTFDYPFLWQNFTINT